MPQEGGNELDGEVVTNERVMCRVAYLNARRYAPKGGKLRSHRLAFLKRWSKPRLFRELTFSLSSKDHNAEAPKELWLEAVNASTYITNRLTRSGAEGSGGEAPILMWRKAMNLRADDATNLSFLRVWYSKAYVHKPKEIRTQAMKIDPRAWIGYLVGYEGDNGHCYRIYNPTTKKITVHRDVVFWEPSPRLSYDGTNDIMIGEIIDGPPQTKTTGLCVGDALFKTIRQSGTWQVRMKGLGQLQLRSMSA